MTSALGTHSLSTHKPPPSQSQPSPQHAPVVPLVHALLRVLLRAPQPPVPVAAQRVRRAVLVSSPTHAPRCLRDACAVARQVGFEGTLSVSPCGTSWTELEPVVLEPPHRPDRQPAVSLAGAPPPFYELARRAARIAHSRTSDAASDALRDDSFRRALDALLVRLERPEAS